MDCQLGAVIPLNDNDLEKVGCSVRSQIEHSDWWTPVDLSPVQGVIHGMAQVFVGDSMFPGRRMYIHIERLSYYKMPVDQLSSTGETRPCVGRCPLRPN